MERKVIEATDLKFTNESEWGEFSCYASTFANWDEVGERPEKGAFAPHLDSFLKDGFIAIGHDWKALPVATPVEAYEDEHGLFLRAEFHSTQAAQDARKVLQERLARGKTAKTSIGYSVLRDEAIDGGRLLKEIRLHEVSLVNYPANPMASVLASKSGEVSTLGFNEHAEALVAAAEAFAERARDRVEFRQKEGRVLSRATIGKIDELRPRLMEVYDGLGELVESAAPKAEKNHAEFERERARFNDLRLAQLQTLGAIP
jgi:HK97 family phage prohead protease